MSEKELTYEELKAMLAEKELTYEELKAMLAEKEKELAQKDAELENAKLNSAVKTGPDEMTLAIIKKENARAKSKKSLLIPQDSDPDSSNTWQCQINGKDYLVPKGKETEVPLAVYEIYMQQEAAKRKALENMRKAQKRVTGSTT